MNFGPERLLMHLSVYGKEKKQTGIMIAPDILEELDVVAKQLKMSRGDLLVACFLRVVQPPALMQQARDRFIPYLDFGENDDLPI